MFTKYLWVNYRKFFLLGILILTLGAFVDAASAFLVAPIFDLILNDHAQSDSLTGITKNIFVIFESLGIPQTTSAALLVFLSIYILKSLLSVLAGYFEGLIIASLIKEMTLNLFQSVVFANWSFFLRKNQGEFINSITRETQNLGFAYQSFNNCVISIFQMLTFGIIALYISATLTVICIVVAIIFALPMLAVLKLNYKWGAENVQSASVSNSITQESFSLSKVIQAYACQENSIAKLDTQLVVQKDLNIKFHTIGKALQEFYYPLGIVSVIAGYYFSKFYNIPFTELTVILYCLWKCVPFMSFFIRNKAQLAQHLPSFENVRQLECEAQENSIKTGSKFFQGFKDKIELKKLEFAYEQSEKSVLKDINLSIKKGDFVGIVGRSGSGKSTLVDILMGFHNVEENQYFIDTVNFSDLDIKSFREKIGYVPQESILFNDTIKNNLLWAKADATDTEIDEACKLANAYGFIQELPDKLNTFVGDRGVRLSGGQVQRLAIARAILRKPEILILDEATSALDSESEKMIQESINRIAHETTLIVIAHRLSTIKNATLVVVIDEGCIIEKGSYEELAQANKRFSEMLLEQQIRNIT